MPRYRMAFAVVKHFPFGGMQRNMLRIAKACAARGHEIDLYASEWTGPEPEDMNVRVLKVRALTNHGRNHKFSLALRKAIAPGGYDCVVGSNKMPDLHVYYAGDPCLAAALERTKPSVCTWLPRYREFLRQEAEVFDKDRDTDILLSAHEEQEKFIRYYATDPSRFHRLPPGIDRNRLVAHAPSERERLKLRQEFGLGPEDPMILSVGSSFRTKGVDRAIRALASLPPETRRGARLIVVGQGKFRAFARMARRLSVGDQVIFVGPREDLARFYYSADLLVHSAYSENTGNALIEAMVCGLPVLTTAACGFASHVLRADAGVVCPLPCSQGRSTKRCSA